MSNIAAVLAVLLSLVPFRGDRSEDPETRRARLAETARLIAEVSRTEHEEARLMALGWHETKFASPIYEGDCDRMPEGERCDGGLARGFWQLHQRACRPAYQHPVNSLESRQAEARCAAKLMRQFAFMGRDHALTPDHAAFAGMGARSWHWPKAEERVKTMREIEQKLARMRLEGSKNDQVADRR